MGNTHTHTHTCNNTNIQTHTHTHYTQLVTLKRVAIVGGRMVFSICHIASFISTFDTYCARFLYCTILCTMNDQHGECSSIIRSRKHKLLLPMQNQLPYGSNGAQRERWRENRKRFCAGVCNIQHEHVRIEPERETHGHVHILHIHTQLSNPNTFYIFIFVTFFFFVSNISFSVCAFIFFFLSEQQYVGEKKIGVYVGIHIHITVVQNTLITCCI